MRKILFSLVLLFSLSLFGCSFNIKTNHTSTTTTIQQTTTTQTPTTTTTATIDVNGSYSSAEKVALYIHTYGRLPKNFITKSKAESLGWVSSKGNLWQVTDHKSIGGDVFSNREGLLPKASGRVYYECDINYQGGFRGAERIVFSNDGLIYYTNDHYESYTRLY